MKWRTHVGVVQGVGQIDLVALACSLVSLVLSDDNRAVKVVLLGDDSQGLDKDGGVLFAGKNQALSNPSPRLKTYAVTNPIMRGQKVSSR